MLKHHAPDLDAVLAAIAHPIRRAIVERLAQGECTVKELAEPHKVTLPAISQHLRVLEEAGLLEQTPEGRVRRCALRAQPLSTAFSWFLQYRVFWENTLDAIQQQVEGATSMTQANSQTQIKHQPASRSLQLTRVFKAPAKLVYNAFLDPDAYAKWLPPNGYTGHVHKMDPRKGGTFRMSFSSLDKKDTHFFGGTYLALDPYKRIVHTDKFETDDPTMQDEMRVTITFEEVDGGTKVTVLHENLPEGPAGEGAPEGWSQSLENLARLVEI